jgi:hypothetical protein
MSFKTGADFGHKRESCTDRLSKAADGRLLVNGEDSPAGFMRHGQVKAQSCDRLSWEVAA